MPISSQHISPDWRSCSMSCLDIGDLEFRRAIQGSFHHTRYSVYSSVLPANHLVVIIVKPAVFPPLIRHHPACFVLSFVAGDFWFFFFRSLLVCCTHLCVFGLICV